MSDETRNRSQKICYKFHFEIYIHTFSLSIIQQREKTLTFFITKITLHIFYFILKYILNIFYISRQREKTYRAFIFVQDTVHTFNFGLFWYPDYTRDIYAYAYATIHYYYLYYLQYILEKKHSLYYKQNIQYYTTQFYTTTSTRILPPLLRTLPILLSHSFLHTIYLLHHDLKYHTKYSRTTSNMLYRLL